EKAIVEFKASAAVTEKQGNVAQTAYNYLCIAEMNKRLGNISEALDYAVQSYERYQRAGMITDLMDAAELRAELLGLNGKNAEAVSAYREFIELKDSVFSEGKMKEITALQAALELEERENEICAQEAQITNLELENESSRNRNLFLLASLLFMAAIAYALFSRQRLKIASQKILVREKEYENEKLNHEIAFKNRELSTKALHIAKKNQVLHQLQSDLQAMANEKGANECVREVVSTLRLESAIDRNWEQFTQQFTELNPDFYKNINQVSEGLSKSDLRLAALLRMNMTSKEIASMLNISDEGIKKARYRLRKKLQLQSEESLEAKIMAI
ncbi:MAG: hypothetical protein HKN79_02695, partial [Flavobacteriales bacterium]|nr:hypothetical protein [Flavobacteriales bacterium]